MTEVRAFSCSICGAVSTEICVYCTKDTCPNHLCSKCLRCSDCCECDVPLEATGHPGVSGLTRLPLGGQGFFVCVPLPDPDGSSRQVLLGEFFYPAVIEAVQNRLRLPALYAIAIDVDGQRIFEEFPESPVLQKLSRESVFSLFNQRINITLSPSEAALKQGAVPLLCQRLPMQIAGRRRAVSVRACTATMLMHDDASQGLHARRQPKCKSHREL